MGSTDKLLQNHVPRYRETLVGSDPSRKRKKVQAWGNKRA